MIKKGESYQGSPMQGTVKLKPPFGRRNPKRKTSAKSRCLSFGTAGGIRTRDLLIRSQTLYPTELQPHVLQTAFIYYHHLFQNASPFFEKNKKIFGGGPARRATETEERAARCARGGGARFAMGRARKMGRNYR